MHDSFIYHKLNFEFLLCAFVTQCILANRSAYQYCWAVADATLIPALCSAIVVHSFHCLSVVFAGWPGWFTVGGGAPFTLAVRNSLQKKRVFELGQYCIHSKNRFMAPKRF